MDYTPLDNIKYYKDCAQLVEALGYSLLALQITTSKKTTRAAITITSKGCETLGLGDCEKVHRALAVRLTALLNNDSDLMMEVSTPGIDHNIKNAAEFRLLTGRFLRVWDKTISEWVSGEVLSSNEKSVTLKVEDKDCTIDFSNIAKAKLVG